LVTAEFDEDHVRTVEKPLVLRTDVEPLTFTAAVMIVCVPLTATAGPPIYSSRTTRVAWAAEA
jgi:hypothetical protein